VSEQGEVPDRWIERGADLLQVAWLRDEDALPLARALADGSAFLPQMIVELAQREEIPRLAPGLRKLLERGEINPEEVALALGTQGDPQDGPRLLALLQRQPHSLKLAAAVMRTGHAVSAEEARLLWRPPGQFDKVLDDPAWLALAREVGSPRLLHALARTARRCAYQFATNMTSDELLERSVKRLAFLAPPDPPAEYDAAALLQALMDTEPCRQERGHFECLLEKVPVFAGAARIEEVADQLTHGGPAVLEALARWKELRMASATGERFLLRHAGCERGIRRLAVRGTAEERAAALEAWFGWTPTGGRGDLLASWIGLFGPGLSTFPENLRCQFVKYWWADGPGPATPDVMVTLLTWLDGLSTTSRLEVLKTCPARWADLSWVVDDSPVWLLRLEQDSERARSVETLLESWAAQPNDGLMRALEQVLTWLRPEVAEEVPGRVLAALDVRLLDSTVLLEWLAADPPKSYRLQQAIVRILLPRLEEGTREAWVGKIIDRLREAKTPRARHLLALIEGEGP
jgi:hypothetical protein